MTSASLNCMYEQIVAVSMLDIPLCKVEEVSRTAKTVAKKKKRSRFDIGTPTKVLQKEKLWPTLT